MPARRLRRAFACAVLAGAALFAGIAPAAADRVATRAGAHGDYGRIVFDWKSPVGHEARIEGRRLLVRFDRPIETGFAAVQRKLGPWVESIATEDGGRSVVATLRGDYRLRSFRSGHGVVVDLMGAPGATAAPATASAPAPAQAQPVRVPVRVARTADYGRLTFAWPHKVPFMVDRQGQTVALRFDAPGEIDIEALRRGLPPQIGAVVLRPADGRLDLGLVVAEDAQLRYFHHGAEVVLDVVAPVPAPAAAQPAPPPRPLGPAARGARQAAAPAEAAARQDSPAPDPLVSVDAERRGAELTIRFNWREPVKAALFQRDAALWIVFDRPARLGLGTVGVIGNGLFDDVAQQPLPGGAAVRLPTIIAYDAAIRRDGTVWVVEIGPSRKPPAGRLAMRAERPSRGGTQLVLPAESPGRVFVLADPAVGDSLYVVPLAQPGLGTHALRRFAEFDLLDSAQGVAVRPLDDGLRVARDAARVVISRAGGLTLSDDAASAASRPAAAPRRLLDFNAWMYGPPEAFKKIEAELFQYVIQPNGLRRSAARLGLARFYVAHDRAAEALGVIAALERDDAALLRDPAFRALRGAANYLIGHYPEALADFDHPMLLGERQIDPWRAAVAAMRGDWQGAYRLFRDTDSIIGELPPWFAIPFELLAAEAALSVGDRETTAVRLSVLDSMPTNGGQLDRVAYLRGHLFKQKDEFEKAIGIWQSVIAQADRPTRAKAAFALINALYEKKKMPLVEAIERLEQLKFAWRDDVFEFDLLQRLGALYAENKDIRRALATLRDAATHFRDIKGAQAVTQQMRALFRRFYLEGDADVVAPVVALGLFNEFRELTPPGEEGDGMVRRLAERLVAVDLLADAADIYDHLVRHRLKDGARAEAGARLAEILLADRKTDAALAALKASDYAEADGALAARRRYLAVRAHSEAGRLAQAMALLGKDTSDEAELMRMRIQWRGGDWKQAALTLARITAPFPNEKLDDREAELVVRRAVALALSGNSEGIAYVRERYGPAMEKTGRAAAFRAVVGRDPQTGEDFAALARHAAELDTFTGLMDKLRPALPAGQTAEIN